MEYRRTAVIKLDIPEGADAHLRETTERFKYCSNTASEWCWHGDDGYHVTSKAKAEQALYDQLREETKLTANLVQKGIHQAVESIKSGVERLKNDQDTSRPTFTADTAIYDKRSATFHRDHVSLSTPDGRILVVLEAFDAAFDGFDGLMNPFLDEIRGQLRVLA